nr:reverse transcriptase domain, reverse transcriptase zinc-binding domain protein [Tanacetum cinerariifolium]
MFTGASVSDAFVEHYESFLGTDTDCVPLDTEGLFVTKVSDQICSDMVRPISDDEIRTAMFDIGDDRAPGPDGFTSAFFKKGWSIVGTDVCNAGLDEFKLGSGLVPSIPKSTAFFCNVPNYVKLVVLNIMPFSEGKLPVKYLGVPLISSRLLNKDCKVLVDQAKTRIGDWKNKSLSFAGVFLWCNGEYKRGKAKVAWDVISLPKTEDGLDIRSLELITPRDVANAGLNMACRVADLVANGVWTWPQAWLMKAPNIDTIPAPILVPHMNDIVQWRNNKVSFLRSRFPRLGRSLGRVVLRCGGLVLFSSHIVYRDMPSTFGLL